MTATQKGKEYALEQLRERRAINYNIPDNSSLPAGSPMYFACRACGAPITVSEGYIPPRPTLCLECDALVSLGWLDE